MWRGGIQKAARKERAPPIGRMSGYAFHPDAFADLDEIWEYIAEDNIDAADRVLADIHSTRTTLAESPQMGHRRPDLTTRPLRFHVVRDEYLIAYAPAEKPLWVLAVFHGRRNTRLMAAVLRDRE
ncbi:MAG: type II toxin-antitoxin system RelE/ParE family toxin [Acidobacteria bacterium]|nr:MAG: type II toxin-antitoxin system RelE/ParE family toxin [Acidobacteriota bacterium]